MSKNLSLFVALLVILGSLPVFAQTVTGPSSAVSAVTYTFTYTDDLLIAPSWVVTGGTINSTSKSGLTYSANVTFNTLGAQTLKIKDGSSLKHQWDVEVVLKYPGVPTSGIGAARCGTGTVPLSAVPGNSGTNIWWYSASSGGTKLGEGTPWVTPSFSTTTTYYAASYNSVSGETSTSRLAVVATFNPLPATPTAPVGDTRCGEGEVSLSASFATPATSLVWYNTSSATSSLYEGATYTPTISASKNYHVAALVGTTGCQSTIRLVVTATFNPNPANPTVPDVQNCGPGAITLSGTPGAEGTTLRWYQTASSTALLTTSLAYTTPSLSASTTYYVKSYNSTTTCDSNRIPVDAVIGAVPSAPSVTGNKRFDAGTLELVATGAPSGATYKWYNANNAFQNNGSTHTTPSLAEDKTDYRYVTVTSALGCVGGAKWVSIDIEPLPSVVPTTTYVAMNSEVTLDAGPGYDTYSWKKSGTSGVLASTQTYNTNLEGTYYVIVGKTGFSNNGQSPSVVISGQFSGMNNNYVVSNNIQVAGITALSQVQSLSKSANMQSVQYFDGLGRPIQTVSTQSSPDGKDLVVPNVYDNQGREFRKYLPATIADNTGRYKSGLVNGTTGDYAGVASAFYGTAGDDIVDDDRPFSETTYESSPLSRPLNEMGPGELWETNDKKVKFAYLSNVNGTASGQEQIIAWEVNASGVPVRTSANTAVTGGGYYLSGLLTIKTAKDEENNETREYTDKSGKVILKKVKAVTGTPVLNDRNDWALTYYIYDDFGNLRFVLQPELCYKMHQDNTTEPTTADLNRFAFQYTYDGKKRMVTKKVPGAGTVYMVYDLRDRVVMTQDGNQRVNNEWLFTKYDGLNRPVYSGIYKHDTAIGQEAMSALISTTQFAETYTGGTTNRGYTNSLFPTLNQDVTPLVVLNYTYYDNYAFVNDQITNASNFAFVDDELTGQETSANQRVVGQVTGTLAKVIGDGATSNLWSVNYYDDKYRPIQTTSANFGSGRQRTTSKYDFVKVTETLSTNIRNGVTSKVRRRFTYDHAGRLLRVRYTVDNNPEIILVNNEYNELGQLVKKKLHSTNSGATYRQVADYRYNIRGWLTRINQSTLAADNAADPADYFGMNLFYNTIAPDIDNEKYFNGNIGAIRWSSNMGIGSPSLSETKERAYRFTYDALNRLTSAIQMKKATLWASTQDFHEKGITYDLNGNIKTLDRTAIGSGLMDDLAYTYTGNQLTKVADAGDDEVGFIDGANTTDEYDYDANGNLTQDLNKDIPAGGIQYNHLNLPMSVTKASDEYINYYYDASGRKLSQQVYDSQGELIKETFYDGEFVYEGENGDAPELKFISNEEGRYLPGVEYQYTLKDHLGNSRVSFTTKPKVDTYTAGYEDANSTVEALNFSPSYASAIRSGTYNRTAGGTKSQRLAGGAENKTVGLARSFAVVPGDSITVEVYARYANLSNTDSNVGTFIFGALTGAFGLTSTTPGDGGVMYQTLGSLNQAGQLLQDGPAVNENQPKAFLNYLLFDSEFVLYDFGFAQVGSAAANGWQKLTLDALPRKAGYVYIYLSNENEKLVDVFFDDLKIEYTHSPVVQADDYYPFGLTFNSYKSGVKNDYLYNGGNERQDELDLNVDFARYRTYDPAIGRWWQVDPIEKYHESPYAWVTNNPILYNDPFGLDTTFIAPMLAPIVITPDEECSENCTEDGGNDIGVGMPINLEIPGSTSVRLDPVNITTAAQNALNYVNKLYTFEERACNIGVDCAVEELTGLPELGGMTANQIAAHVKKSLNWRATTVGQVQGITNNGGVVIAVSTSSTGSGHVVMGVPGTAVSSGAWGGEVPVAMDTGPNKKWASKSINWSYGTSSGVEFYEYVGPVNTQQ